MNDSGATQKIAAVAWLAKFGRLDQLDWLIILMAVLAGTLAKQRHFLDFPDWFLDWGIPVPSDHCRLQGAPEDN
jgi:hypothetical protein